LIEEGQYSDIDINVAETGAKAMLFGLCINISIRMQTESQKEMHALRLYLAKMFPKHY